MRGRQGGSWQALVLSIPLLCIVSPVLGVALDPNEGSLVIGDSIGFNLAQNQLVFDKSQADMGALIPVSSATAAGWVESDSNPGYAGPYSFALQITIPLTDDNSGSGNAEGWFGDAGETYAYSLIDLENGNAVLLSGEITAPFGLTEAYNQVYSFRVTGDWTYAPIPLTVTGGSLAAYWPSAAEMAFQYSISSPPIMPGMVDFSVDLTAGSGSVSIYAVPEPMTLSLLLGGALLGLGVGRKSRASRSLL
ncbi:MAG: PEP-CTERM sorting domain-containing protein [Phycisphaerae bacterium]|nr:PEP-CTERM sorting domain-containing protein [Phycisphaerae bacterium]